MSTAASQTSTPTHTNRFTARDLALIAVFAAVTAALGLIPPLYVPVSPVPITAQSLGPMLAGSILGGRRGCASQVLFLALVAIGLPLLSGGRGGIGVFFGVSFGFLIGWAVIAAGIGWATYRIGAPYSLWKGIVVCLGFGIVVLYCLGIPGMMLVGQLSPIQALAGNLPYIPGDIVKAIVAGLVAKGVHSAYPGLLPWQGQPATRLRTTPADQFRSE